MREYYEALLSVYVAVNGPVPADDGLWILEAGSK